MQKFLKNGKKLAIVVLALTMFTLPSSLTKNNPGASTQAIWLIGGY